jgi:hypothetical protein
MDEYQIALSPDLGLSPADFIAVWNEDTETHAITEARLAPSSSTHYDPTLIAAILLSIGTGIAGNTLYDLIKRVLVKKGIHTHTHRRDEKARWHSYSGSRY